MVLEPRRTPAEFLRSLRLLRLVSREDGWLSLPRHTFLRLMTRLRQFWIDDFVFIHINKCGGTSISKALGVPLIDHETAAEKRRRLGRKRWDSRFKFALVRNPFAKIVSHYEYRRMTNQTGLGTDPISFEEWAERAYIDHDDRYHDSERMFMPQIDWVSDGSGQIIVDHVGKLETIASDFATVCDRLGRDVELPHLKSSRGRAPRNYRGYYSPRLRRLVEDTFAADLEQFDYEF